jgi:uncharacterized Zn-finger protein
MIPANTEVNCPSCDTEFLVERDMQEDDIVHCTYCDTKLVLINGDLLESDIVEDIEESELSDIEDDDEGTR